MGRPVTDPELNEAPGTPSPDGEGSAGGASSASDQAPRRPVHRRAAASLSRRARTPGAVAALVIALLAFGSLLIAHRAGAVPQGDDWSYVKTALALHRTGHIQLQGWGQMFMLGQIFTAQPLLWILPDHTLTLDIYGAIAMSVWLGCAWALGRRIVGEWRAVLLVLALAVWPGTGVLTASFMTDAPSAAASLGCVFLGVLAITKQSRLLLAFSLLAGLFAFTIREQLVVGLLAVVLGALVARGLRRRFRVEAVVGAAVVAIICAVLEHLRHQLPNPDLAPFGFGTLNFSSLPPTLLPCLFTIALAVSPLSVWTLLSLRLRDLLNPGRLIGWALGVWALGHIVNWTFDPIPHLTLPNYVTAAGSVPVTAPGSSPHIMSDEVFRTMQVLAMISGVLIVGELGARLTRPARLWTQLRDRPAVLVMTVYTVLLAGFATGLAFGGQAQFDRYLLAMFPGFGMLLLRTPSSERVTVPVRVWRTGFAVVLAATTVFLGCVALDSTVSSDIRDAAVWRAAARLEADGVPSDTINAGLNWDGIHAKTATDRVGALKLHAKYSGQHWTLIFPKETDCYIVTVSPKHLHSWILIRHTHLRPYGFGRGRFDVYTYYRTTCTAVPR